MGNIDVDFVIVTQYYVMRMNMFQVINVQHVLGDQQMLLVMIQLVPIQAVQILMNVRRIHAIRTLPVTIRTGDTHAHVMMDMMVMVRLVQR